MLTRRYGDAQTSEWPGASLNLPKKEYLTLAASSLSLTRSGAIPK